MGSEGIAYTKEVARYASSLSYVDIPPDVADMGKIVILDTLGVIIAATAYRAAKIITEFIHEQGGTPECTVVGANFKTSLMNAALANGVMGHDMELDDTYQEARLHPAAVIVPAALAVGECQKASGAELIAAVIGAYDVEARVSLALGGKRQYARSFHPTAVCGAFGAAVAAGKLMKLDPDTFTIALGLAGCQASGLNAWTTERGHYTKSFQTGIPSRSGVTAAMLAAKGFGGPPAIFEGDNNIFNAFSGEHNYAPLLEELGSRFEIMQTSLKRYSCCRQIHSPLDAFFSIVRENSIQGEDIEHMNVKIATFAVPTVDNNELITHNLQYILAVAAYDGKVLREQYSPERSKDPKLWELARRITFTGDEELDRIFPAVWAGIVSVTTKERRTFTARVDYAKGSPQARLTHEEVEDKFLTLSQPVLGKARTVELLKTVRDLESMKDISALTELLQG